MRCIRGGFECRGYDDETHVVVYHPGKLANESHAFPPVPAGAALTVLPSALRDSALKSAWFDAAWATLHPTGAGAFDVRSGLSYCWVLNLSAVHVRETPLHAAFAAVALARVGQAHRDTLLDQKSHVAYFQALQGIKRQLLSRKQAPVIETMTTCLVLSMYEAIRGSSQERMPAMLAHSTGSREIARAQGPKAFTTPLAQAMLKDIRQQAIIESFGSRKPSFLTNQAWSKAVPATSTKDDLFEIIAAVPPLMERFDGLKFSSNQLTASGTEAVHQDLRKVIQTLDSWHDCNVTVNAYSYETPTSLGEARLNELGLEHLEICQRKRVYLNVTLAELELLYLQTRLILLLELLDMARFTASTFERAPDLCTHCESMHASRQTCVLAIDSTRIMQLARSCSHAIVQSLEYVFEPQSGVLTASHTVFPMVAAFAFLKRLHDPAAKYVLALVEEYQQRTGARVADTVMATLAMVLRDDDGLPRWLTVDQILKEASW